MATPPLSMIVPCKLRQLTPSVRGVIHVGMSWGEEIADYLAMGASHVIGFEPVREAYEEAVKLYGKDQRVLLENLALGNTPGLHPLRVVDDPNKMPGHPVGTGGSSFLPDVHPLPPAVQVWERSVPVMRFEDWLLVHPQFIPEQFDALVVDVQGMELDVLQGFGGLLKHFDYANIECSREPVYEGEAPAQEVVDYLTEFGLYPRTPIEEHNDILFSR